MCKTMKNGDYLLIVAPKDYPGKKYRNKYCYEHHYVWWKNTGELISYEDSLHHINGDKHDNRFENLEKVSRREHPSKHFNKTSKYVGVCWNKWHNKWESKFSYKGKKYFVGFFSDEKKAHKEREELLLKIATVSE